MHRIAIAVVAASGLLANLAWTSETERVNAVGFENGSVLIEYTSEYGNRASTAWIALGLIDGRTDVGWSSRQSAPVPHTFLFELARPYEIDTLSFDTANTEWRTHDGISAGHVTVLASSEARKGPFNVVFDGDLDANTATVVSLPAHVRARWLKLSITNNGGHSQYTELMEFQALGTPEPGARERPELAGTYKTNWNPFFIVSDTEEVRGCYDYDGGTFSGNYAEDFVTMEWREHGPQIGKAVLAITADGAYFNGFWYEDGAIQGYWHGQRSEDAPKPACASRLLQRASNPVERALDETGRAALYGVYFDYDSDVLKPDSARQLRRVHAWLSARPANRVVFTGHTDSDGSEEYNADLSLRRAQAVISWLVANGVDEPRMSALGLGEQVPVASNLTVHGKALNRRVEVKRSP